MDEQGLRKAIAERRQPAMLTPMQRLVELMERLAADGQEPSVTIVCQRDEWSISLMWGHEAADSPMVGAHALGLANTLDEAVLQALTEAGA